MRCVKRDAALGVAILWAVKLLIDDRVNPVVASMLERDAGARWISQERAVNGEALVVKPAHMAPGADHHARCEALILLCHNCAGTQPRQ